MSAMNPAAEAIPFGGPKEPDTARPWTQAEQDRHYADLCDAIGAKNDRATTHRGTAV